MLDLSLGKVLVIAVVALFLVGPEKLPQYAAQLARWVRVARSLADGAKQRLADEMGPEFDDVDWAAMDPRRYHPRRLIADAWNAEPAPSGSAGPGPGDAASEHDGPDLLALAEARAVAAEPVRTDTRRLDLGA